jgi:hypothetical protein
MVFFILTHTIYSVCRRMETPYVVVLISFVEKRLINHPVLSNQDKKTRKTIFCYYSKLKLFEVIRHFCVSYSQYLNN